MDDAVSLEAPFHGERLAAAFVSADKLAHILVEGADVALQVEESGVRPAAALSGTTEDHSHLRVDVLVLVQEPGVPELLAALITPDNTPVVLLPVLQELRPGPPREGATFLLARVPPVHLLVSLQLAGEGESHLAAFKGALVRRLLSVLLTHVRVQLFVLPEFKSAAVVLADVLLAVLAMNAAGVSLQVGVGGEGLRAAFYGAEKRLRPGVTELVPRQVVLGAEGLTAALALTGEGLHSGVFAQVSVQLPLFVINGRAVGKRA